MEIRFDPAPARQTVTPLQAPTRALHEPAEEPADQAPDASARTVRTPTVTHIDDRVQSLRRELRFRVDETTGLTVVRVVDAETGTLIRQIPSQPVLEMHAARDSTRGQLLREQA